MKVISDCSINVDWQRIRHIGVNAARLSKNIHVGSRFCNERQFYNYNAQQKIAVDIFIFKITARV